MTWILQAGGAPIWFTAIFGLWALGAAALFARQPARRRLEVVRWLQRATLCSVGAGFTASIAAVGTKVPAHPEWAHSPDLPLILLTGVGESMAVGILGFTLLSLASFITAIGVRRMPELG